MYKQILRHIIITIKDCDKITFDLQFQSFVRFLVGDPTNNLLKVTINLVSQSICNRSYGYDTKLPSGIVNEWQICAGENGKDTCQVTMQYCILFIIII